MAKDAVAIVDIGSNSVRLVVYAGAERVRDPIFNEKLLAGLGKGLSDGGLLAPRSRSRALAALARFKLLLDAMKVGRVEVLATAAVRDAADGPGFVREVRALGLPCRVVRAEEEAELAGLGVLYGIPGADGIVGDLGGGSLELIEIGGGATGRGLSMPLGVLRVEASPAGRKAARATLREAIDRAGISCRGKPFFMVGGSWRALARVEMALSRYPLPIVHLHRISPKRAGDVARAVSGGDAVWLAAAPSARQTTAPAAAMLLELIVEELQPSELVTSASGLREGALFARMSKRVRALDPLIEAARQHGAGGRFGQHGDQLDAWIAPLFADDLPAMRRLRLAACLMADVAWQADAAFRTERAIESALHGNWLGVDARGRVLIARALASSFGAAGLPDPALDALCAPGELERAHQWGLAIRLGQRLSAGVGSIFARVPLVVEPGGLALDMADSDLPLASEAVAGRLAKLAEAVGRTARQ